MSIQERVDQVKKEFSSMKEWEERYARIIHMGKQLKPLDEKFKTESSIVKGCQSQVWLKAELTPAGQIHFEGDSDALLVKGLVSLLIRIFSESKPSEIMEASTDFLKEIGLDSHLSPSRTNGLYSMIKQMKFYALAFDHILKSK